MPGTVLRVIVGGQSAGGAERVGETWRACWFTAAHRDRMTEHPTAAGAVRAVLRSGWARKLGARAESDLIWTDLASRAAAPKGRVSR